jgi:hypothetical protein
MFKKLIMGWQNGWFSGVWIALEKSHVMPY